MYPSPSPERHPKSSESRAGSPAAYNGSMSTADPRGADAPEPAPAASIAIVGAGPRGASLLERLGANLADPASPLHGRPLVVHVIDDAESGAGRIWRTDQTRELCMNTLADAVTLFTEPGSTVAGPVVEGPTLFEWCLLVEEAGAGAAAGGAAGAAPGAPRDPGSAVHDGTRDPRRAERLAAVPASHRAAFAAFPARAGLAADYREELAVLRPESHPSRALYGEYLAWCFARAEAALPDGVEVVRHRTRAVGVSRVDGRERVRLEAGGDVLADAVVVAAGWMPLATTDAEQAILRHLAAHTGFAWVPPGSPVEQDLSVVPDGARAIVRGLGMGFFDTAALLTVGRGGRFVADPSVDCGLRYEPSGREPILHVTSRRGVPFRAKSRYGGLPPRSAQRYVRAVDWAGAPRPIDFDRLLWPRIVADAHLDYLETLHRVRPEALAGDPERALAAARAAIERTLEELLGGPIAEIGAPAASGAADAAPTAAGPSDRDVRAARLDAAPRAFDAALAPFIPDPADRFDLLGEMHPAAGGFASAEAFGAWVRERVARDLREAELGIDSPLKAGLWSVSSARGAAQTIGTVGGFDAESLASGYAMTHGVGGMAGSGPPAFRNRQLLALVDAGIVRFIGPGARLVLDERGFSTVSPVVGGSEVSAPVLIDAWMHFHDVAATADPLARSLLEAGRARAFRIAARPAGASAPRGHGAFETGTAFETGAGAVHADAGADALDGALNGARNGGDDPAPAGTVATAAFDIDPATGLLVGADGSLDPAVHVAGIPVDDVLHGTIISPMPGTDPPMLRETDRVARSAIRVAAGGGE